MSKNIYKAYVFNNSINKYDIYIFVGKYTLSKLDEIQKDFIKNPKNDIFNEIFSKKDYNYFNDDLSNVKFVNDLIYESSTLEEITIKISKVSNITYEELYLCGESMVDFDYDDILYNLTHEGYIEKEKLLNFLSNCIVNNNIKQIISDHEKTLFNYNDLLDLKILESISYIEKPIGIQFNTEHNFQYFHNPYEYKKDIYNFKSEYNYNNPLFSYHLATRNLWVYPFNDDFENKMEIIKLYYPLLQKYNFNEKSFNDIKKEIQIKQDNIEQDSFNKREIINGFLHKKYDGEPIIKYLQVNLKPRRNMFISLETLFKIFPTDGERSIYLLKYNPGMKSEKLFKLATNDIKEPILKRIYIQKINSEMSSTKNRYVTIYIEHNYKKNILPIIIEIYETGIVNVSINNTKLTEDKRFEKYRKDFELKDYEIILNESYNEIIKYINSYYEHSGVNLPLFHSFYTRNIDIKKMDLVFKYKIEENKFLKNINNIEDNLSNIIQVISNSNNSLEMNIVPLFKIDNFQKIVLLINLIDKRSKMFEIKLQKINHIGYIEYFRYFIFSLLFIFENPKEFIKTIKENNIYIENEFEEPDILRENDEKEYEDDENLYDEEKKTTKSTTNSKSNKGFDFNESDDDNDSFLNSENSNESDEWLGGSTKERNFLQKRMEQRDPNMFINHKKIEGALPYSRWCPSSISRQPVSLNKEEFKNIDKDSYKKYLEYGSDENSVNYYICPRYWCEEKNISLKEGDVQNKNNKLISDKCKKEDGTYSEITEFNHKKQHTDKDGSYLYNVPSLSEKSCIPCCFKKSNENNINSKCISKTSDKMIETGTIEKEQSIPSINTDKSTEKNIKQKYDYIQQHNKFPLGKQKWGYLPLNIQSMLDYEKIKCHEDFCLLRFGVDNEKNSFISALGSILYFERNPGEKMNLGKIKSYNIKETLTILTDSLSLDEFVTLQNGNLIYIFGNSTNEIDISKHKDSLFYEKVFNKQPKLLYFAVNALYNFIEYINNTNNLDYFFLYDLITSKNKKLFKNGINLIIFEVDSLEISNKFRFICPTNFYKYNYFDKTRDTIMMIKYKNYFEPIYGRPLEVEGRTNVAHSFMFTNKYLINLFLKLESLQNNRIEYCGYRNLVDSEYHENSLNYILDLLIIYKFTIVKQIIYYNGKVCGIECIHNSNKYFIPCILSGIKNEIDYVHVNNYKFNDYNTTKNNLIYVYNVCEQKIPCKPVSQITDDKEKNVMGIVTSDNLIVPLEQIERITDDMTFSKNNTFIIQDNKKNNIDEVIFNNDVNKSTELKEVISQKKRYQKLQNKFRKLIHQPHNKHLNYKFINILYNYKLDFNKKLSKLYEIFDKLIKNDEFDNELIIRLLNDIITNYRLQQFYTIDDQYLYVNNYSKNKNEIIITQDLLNKSNITIDRNIFDKNDLYKNIQIKNNVHDYTEPNQTLIDKYNLKKDLNTIINYNDIKEVSKINKPVQILLKSLKTQNKKKECPKRCRKGTKCDKKIGECVSNIK